jgi:hypothetical protein
MSVGRYKTPRVVLPHYIPIDIDICRYMTYTDIAYHCRWRERERKREIPPQTSLFQVPYIDDENMHLCVSFETPLFFYYSFFHASPPLKWTSSDRLGGGLPQYPLVPPA